MPAPKDPEKYKIWKEKVAEASKSRKPWNKGKKLKDDPEHADYLAKLSEVQKGRRRGPTSEETKKKISDSLKGKQTGKVVSEETRAKLSKASKGRKMSEEQKLKLSESKKGKPASLETKAKMSAARKGKPGHIPSEDTKKKISETLKAKGAAGTFLGMNHTEEAKAKISAALKGKPRGALSDNTKRKISLAHTGRKHDYRTPGFTGHNHTPTTKTRISKTSKQNGPNAGTFKTGRVLSSTELKRLLDISVGKFKQGYHESPKAGRIRHRSSYELEVYKQLDVNDEIAMYEVEAIRIPYEWEGAQHWYVPDLLIHFKDSDWRIVEIKPNDHTEWPKNQAKFSAAHALYGDRFEVWSEELIFQ